LREAITEDVPKGERIMVDPTSLSAIAVLVATKALESTGEKLGESTWNLVGKFLAALKRKHASTATAIEKVAQTPELSVDKPDVYGIETLISQVEAAAQDDSEVRQALLRIADEVKKQPGTITNISKLAEKVGTLVQGNDNTFNISNNF
jgi:hypothetical protein